MHTQYMYNDCKIPNLVVPVYWECSQRIYCMYLCFTNLVQLASQLTDFTFERQQCSMAEGWWEGGEREVKG